VEWKLKVLFKFKLATCQYKFMQFCIVVDFSSTPTQLVVISNASIFASFVLLLAGKD